MKDSRCKVCGRDVTGLPSVFNLGWWYCYEHWDKSAASTGSSCDTLNNATKEHIANRLRDTYESEDYASICPHCDDKSFADNIVALVAKEIDEAARETAVTEYVIDLPDQPSGLVGPFASKELANQYADRTLGEVSWQVRELYAPD